MKSVRQRLLDSRNILMTQQSGGLVSKAHISFLKQEVAQLTNVVLEEKRENLFMRQLSELLYVTKTILQVQKIEPHTKSLEEKLITALGEIIAKCNLSVLEIENKPPKKSSVVTSEQISITNTNLQIEAPRNSPILTKLTRLIQANKIEQVIYQSVNYMQDHEMLFTIFNSIKGIPCPYKAEQLSVRYLRQLLNTVALLNAECNHHEDELRLELPKAMVLDGLNLLVRNGEGGLLKQWIRVNKCGMCVAAANQLISHTTSESGSRIKLLLYDMACIVFETVADEQVNVIRSSPFRSRSATTRTMDQMQERLTRCQLGAIDCCLMLNEPERALQMIRKWDVAYDQTITTTVPSEKIFNLLAKQPSATVAARVVSQLLLDSKVNWPQIIQFAKDATYFGADRVIQNHAQKASPTSDMVVTLLAAILNEIMENIPLTDQPEEITRIAQQIGKQSLQFWSTLMGSVPRKDSQQAAVIETCTHRTNACPDRMVYLVQLVTAVLLELTDSAEETIVHGCGD
ncbi:hypothetical protein EG68_01391 [Paragonimus skrjabini miyazakii]|uniref:Uncharacterized protein n=1 Tax=Paragonimus skrjabini miyazakii TaxID=59628 RepID=A0A8S9Z6N3_9TREM|nr:hypothetical protein EG68_01391 [Paragonimus skrjabini miyazakii]